MRCIAYGFAGVVAGLISLIGNSAHANVYATNLRLNGATTNLVYLATTNVTVSYLLNEAATAGITISIKSGTNVIRTIDLASGAGTLRGTNSVVWNGKDNNTNTVASGTFTVEVKAKAVGFGGWTQTSDDANEPNYAAMVPAGIAVNCNSNSPYYGRVYVANSSSSSFVSGVSAGIIKCNADCSPASDGLFSAGGWPWAANGRSPWKLEVSSDDFVYANDWASNGVVLRFNPAVASASRVTVLTNDNWPNGGAAKLSGPAVSGSGTNTLLWLADTNLSGAGVRRFGVGTNGAVATSDTGVTAVNAGAGSQLNRAPYDVAIDRSNRIYAIQFELGAGNVNNRAFRFPAYSGAPLTTADWQVGASDNNFRGASGIAVNPAGTLVAVALQGEGVDFARTGGGVRVLNAASGATVVTLTPDVYHNHGDVAWDNVGNLYACDYFDFVWRVYSPPGGNEATTVALGTVQFSPATSPTLSNPAYAGGQFQFTINGQADVVYVVLGSTNLVNWTPITTNVSASATRNISVSAPAPYNFYRAQVQ